MKLLIVDDEKLTRSGLRSSIDGEAYGIDTILEAANGREGLKVAKEHLPEIILTDMRMPQMSGVEMAERLRDLLPDSAFIFMSGYSDREYLKAAIHLKAVSYVEKPLDMGEVREAIRKAAEQILTNSLVRRGRDARDFVNSSRLAEIFTSAGPFSLPEDVSLPEDMRPEGSFTSVIVKLDRSVDINSDTLYSHISKRLDPLLQKYGLNEVFLLKENGCCCLFLYGQKHSRNELLKLCGQIRSVFAGFKPAAVVLGDSVQGIAHAYQTYASAVILLQSAFFCESGSILSNTEEAYVSRPILSDRSPEFFNALNKDDRAMAEKIIEELKDQFAPPSRLLPSQARDAYYQFFLQLKKAARQAHLKEFLEKGSRSVWDTVENAENLEELHQELLSAAGDYFEGLAERESGAEAGSHMVFTIQDFIRENYQNESLSIKSISEHVKRSAPYVCTLFKAETGLTLNQYITEYRVGRAREMLSDPRYKVVDVAVSVGYADVNYFGKIFKKVTGVSPSEYRSGK